MTFLKKNKKVWIASKILMILAFVALFGMIIMLLWNWLMPDIFGVKSVSYLQALGLFLLSKLFSSGFTGHGRRDKHGHASWRKHYKKVEEELSPESGKQL